MNRLTTHLAGGAGGDGGKGGVYRYCWRGGGVKTLHMHGGILGMSQLLLTSMFIDTLIKQGVYTLISRHERHI